MARDLSAEQHQADLFSTTAPLQRLVPLTLFLFCRGHSRLFLWLINLSILFMVLALVFFKWSYLLVVCWHGAFGLWSSNSLCVQHETVWVRANHRKHTCDIFSDCSLIFTFSWWFCIILGCLKPEKMINIYWKSLPFGRTVSKGSFKWSQVRNVWWTIQEPVQPGKLHNYF